MSRETKRIAVIIDFITSDYSVIFLSGIKAACEDYKLEVLNFPIGELNRFESPFDYQLVSITSHIKKNNIDGIIVQSSSMMHYITKSQFTSYIKSYKSLPIVNVTTKLDGITSITVDCSKAYKTIIENLVYEQGCKKFGILGIDSNSYEVKSREKGINDSLKKCGIPAINITSWKATFDYEKAFSELDKYYNSQPKELKDKFDFDALIAFNDEMGFACIDFCKKIGKKIPEDIVVVGYDDIERSLYSIPPLTSINQQIYEQGYEAVRLLLNKMNGKEIPEHTVIDAKPMFRKSSLRKEIITNSKSSKIINYAKTDLLDKQKNNLNDFGRTSFMQNEWYQKRGQFYQVTKFYTDMQNDMSLEQLQKRINGDLKSFGMQATAIVIYENPIEKATPFEYFHLPHKAFIFSVFDYSTNVDFNASEIVINFDPNDCIIPEGYINIDSSGMYVLPIYHHTLQYGYMIIRKGTYDISIYDLVSKILCTIISTVYSFDRVNLQREKISEQYSELDIVANTDELTGVYNRRGLFDLGVAKINRLKACNKKGYVVYCDIDGLKKINDTYGHEAGDIAIKEEAAILKRNFGKNDVVARIGGDEFVIVGDNFWAAELENVKERIDYECKKWVKENKSPYKLSISIGFIAFPSDKSDYDLTSLLSEADSVLYAEKRRKKSIKSDK